MESFKKANSITLIMMGTVIGYGVIAWFLCDRHGYGASSEGKMNFARLIVWIFSATQFALALGIHKMKSAVAKTPNPARLLTLQIATNAFCEAIALFGLVLGFMSKNFMDYVTFGVFSLAAFMVFFPKQNDWELKSEITGA